MIKSLTERAFGDSRGLALILAGLAFVTHFGAVLAIGDTSMRAMIWEYGYQASCALTHGDFCMPYLDQRPPGHYPSAYMPPLMSFIWLADMSVFGDTPTARFVILLFNALLSMGSAVLAFTLARQLGLSRLAAFLAGAILTLYPTFLVIGATYHQTALTVFLELALACLAAWALNPKNPRPGLSAGLALGVVCGLSALNRTEMLLIGPAIVLLIAVWRRSFTVLVVAGVVTAAMMAPWVIRNYEVFHRVIPVAQSTGYNLWKSYTPFTNGSGNYAEAPGSRGQVLSQEIYSATPSGPDFETRLQEAYSAQFSEDLKAAGIPRLMELAVNKFLLLWGLDWTDHETTLTPAYLIPWLVVNGLAVFGLVLALQGRVTLARETVIVCATIVVLTTAAFVALFIHARYRMHIEPFIFLFAAIGAERVLAFVSNARPSSLGRSTG